MIYPFKWTAKNGLETRPLSSWRTRSRILQFQWLRI
jgi:hypothetical protein